MSNAIATRPANGAMSTSSERDRLTRNLILKNASDDQLALVLAVCERYKLDPLLKHVVLISGSLYITRDGLMHLAHASGQLDGMEVEATQDANGQWIATCRVWRKDMSRPFVYSTYQREQQNAASTVWKSAPRAMTIKTSEVACLRRAFDVSLGAAEEVGFDGTTSRLGRVDVIEADHTTPAPSGAAPQPPVPSSTSGATPPKRAPKPLTPEETISFIRDHTKPLDKRRNAIGYLYGLAPDADTLNRYFAAVVQYTDGLDGEGRGGKELGEEATERFHAAWERFEPTVDSDVVDAEPIEAVAR